MKKEKLRPNNFIQFLWYFISGQVLQALKKDSLFRLLTQNRPLIAELPFIIIRLWK